MSYIVLSNEMWGKDLSGTFNITQFDKLFDIIKLETEWFLEQNPDYINVSDVKTIKSYTVIEDSKAECRGSYTPTYHLDISSPDLIKYEGIIKIGAITNPIILYVTSRDEKYVPSSFHQTN